MASTNSDYVTARDNYNSLLGKYTGNAGYENSLTEAAKGAATSSQAAGAQAQSQARQAGMTKAQAAAMGANNASEQYGKSFTDQQTAAQKSGESATEGAKETMSSEQTEGNNKYNRAWGNVGGITNAVGAVGKGVVDIASDKNMKTSRVISKGSEYGNMQAAKQAKDYKAPEGVEDTKKDYKKAANDTFDSLSNFKAPSVSSDAMMKISYKLDSMKPHNYRSLIWKKH